MLPYQPSVPPAMAPAALRGIWVAAIGLFAAVNAYAFLVDLDGSIAGYGLGRAAWIAGALWAVGLGCSIVLVILDRRRRWMAALMAGVFLAIGLPWVLP